MSEDESNIVLDLPEEDKKTAPRVFPKILMVGVAMVVIASIIKIAGFLQFGLGLFIFSWAILVLHFSLRLKANFRNHKYVCLRDLGRLGVVTAIIMKLLGFPFVLPTMIFSGLLYAAGYFGAWMAEAE